jgi:hypothetical protein
MICKCSANPIMSSNPIYSHTYTWQYDFINIHFYMWSVLSLIKWRLWVVGDRRVDGYTHASSISLDRIQSLKETEFQNCYINLKMMGCVMLQLQWHTVLESAHMMDYSLYCLSSYTGWLWYFYSYSCAYYQNQFTRCATTYILCCLD